MTSKNNERFHKYGWIAKGRKYWTLCVGNPFVMQCFHVSIERPKEEVIEAAKKDLARAERRWKKKYPEDQW